jgi:hypothetical protein
VTERKDASRHAPRNAAAVTGRDGAIDFAARTAASDPSEPASPDESNRFARVIGEAAIALWGDLPRAIQEQLFERAVVLGHRSERDEMLREQLAKFLHDHHRRTTGSDPRRE